MADSRGWLGPADGCECSRRARKYHDTACPVYDGHAGGEPGPRYPGRVPLEETRAHSEEEPESTYADPFSSPTAASDDDPGPWFPASFDSECAICDGLISIGDEIRADGSGGYECQANCAPYDSADERQTQPVTDHRKWCTRCRLIGHYAADCTTAVLEGGAVSVPVATVAEPDPFETPTQPAEEVNVSGQPKARYEWYGKQNRGYLVKLPETGDFRRYKNGKPKGLTRATTFNKAATDQNALGDWKARNVLIGASKRPDLVAQAHGLTHEDNRDQLMKLVAELETTAGAKVSADVGTLIHELTEQWDAGRLDYKDIPAAYRELIGLYDATLREAGLRPAPGLIERTTYIPEFGGVVGTLDRVYYHERSGQYVIGDVKTGKTLKYGMDEIETQEWIYAHGVNNAGVYDWNTDAWQPPRSYGDSVETGPWEVPEVSEDWGVVVHMPVQGPDAGKVMLVRADLQRGRRHAEVCHDVRVQRANKPKPEAWTGEELKTPETAAESVSGTDWDMEFSEVLSREDAAAVWQTAYDRGVPPEEMARLKDLADARLAELEKAMEGPADVSFWERRFTAVTTVADAGRAWEQARADGVEPLELSRLVGLAQQRLRELGVSG